MPRKLVLFITSELYSDNLNIVIARMQKGKFGQWEQLVARVIVEIPYDEVKEEPKSKPAKPPKAATKLANKIFRRKSKVREEPAVRRYPSAEGVSDAYKKLARTYLPGDHIHLIGMSGISEETIVVKDTIAELIKHLHAGTEPPVPPPRPTWRHQPETPPREIFNFQLPPPNQLLGNPTVVSSVTMIHRIPSTDLSYTDEFRDQFPTNIRRLVSINWASEFEASWHIVRDKMGNLTSREVIFFEAGGWLANLATYSTRGYLLYRQAATVKWALHLPFKMMNVSASLLPSSLRSSNSSPSTSWSGTTARSETGATPVPRDARITESPRSSISSGSNATSQSASASSSRSSATSIAGSCNALTSEPSSLSSASDPSSSTSQSPLPSTPQTTASSVSSSPSSSSASTSSSPSTSLTPQSTSTPLQPPAPNSTLTSKSPTSLDHVKPQWTEKHEMWCYKRFGARNEDWFLPEVVVWKSSFVATGQ